MITTQLHSPQKHKTLDWILWCLRIALFIQAWGFYLKVFGHTSAVNTTLFIDLDLAESIAKSVDRGMAIVLLVGAAANLWFPRKWLVLPMTLWMLIVAWLEVMQGAKPFSHYSGIAWAIRYGSPVVFSLWLIAYTKNKPAFWGYGQWVARVCLALTFFAHGMEALGHHPRFIDLMSGSWYRVSALWLAEDTAKIILTIIGVIDILCALLILVPKWTKWIGGYMVFWGCITALSRMTEMGSPGLAATLLRASHGLLPLALWLLYRHLNTNDPVKTTDTAS